MTAQPAYKNTAKNLQARTKVVSAATAIPAGMVRPLNGGPPQYWFRRDALLEAMRTRGRVEPSGRGWVVEETR